LGDPCPLDATIRDRKRSSLGGSDLAEVSLGPRGEERADDCGIELGTGAVAHLGESTRERQRLPVGPVRRHRIEGVGEREDPSAGGNLLARPAAGIAVPVPVLVVEKDVRQGWAERGKGPDQTGTGERVTAHLEPLALVQRTWLMEDGGVEIQLAHIVQLAPEPKRSKPRRAPAEPSGDHLRDDAHAGRMTPRVRVSRFDCMGQRGQHHAWFIPERA